MGAVASVRDGSMMTAASSPSHGPETGVAATHQTASATHAGTTTAEGHGSGGGLPQFEIQHWGGQIVYLLILFFILQFLISKVFAPRLRRVMDERSDTISGAVATA